MRGATAVSARDQVPPRISSTILWSSGLVPPTPTATHDVDFGQAMPRSWFGDVPDGLGVATSVQALPSQCSAKGTPAATGPVAGAKPTALQLFGLEHETPNR